MRVDWVSCQVALDVDTAKGQAHKLFVETKDISDKDVRSLLCTLRPEASAQVSRTRQSGDTGDGHGALRSS